jgi:hypothetical protein
VSRLVPDGPDTDHTFVLRWFIALFELDHVVENPVFANAELPNGLQVFKGQRFAGTDHLLLLGFAIGLVRQLFVDRVDDSSDVDCAES